jgi:short-subunit dehydrogenase
MTRAVAVVTGASSGIGAEFARALAARDYDLILIARRKERLNKLAEELRGRHSINAEALSADLARDEDVAHVVRRVAAEERLALLVNNAGFGVLGRFHQADIEADDNMYRVHVLATARLTRAALPGLIARDRGAIINVSSVAGLACIPGHLSYASTKAWMIAFSECLHLELRGSGSAVRIQALCPGYTYTEFHDVLGLDRDSIMPNRRYWMTSAFVVSRSLRALKTGKWLVVPGWRYQALAFLLRSIPRSWLYPILMREARRREQAEPSSL